MSERWYLAGAMTGLPGFNYLAFHRVAIKLRAEGFEIINPAELGPSETPYEECMRRCAPHLIHPETVGCFIMNQPTADRWACSRGASWEVYTMLMLGKQAVNYDDDPAKRVPIERSHMMTGPMFMRIRPHSTGAGIETASTAGYTRIGVGEVPAGDERCDNDPTHTAR